MKQYKGNRFPFCCALYTAVDAPEAVAVIETLERQRIRCAVPARRREDCIARASVVLLFLSPEAAHDEAVLKGVNAACAAGKTILTVFLRETWMSPGLSMQLGQMQAIPKFREESEEAFYQKLLNAPALRTMSVTQQQKKSPAAAFDSLGDRRRVRSDGGGADRSVLAAAQGDAAFLSAAKARRDERL